MPGKKTFWLITYLVFVALFRVAGEGNQEPQQEAQGVVQQPQQVWPYGKERDKMVEDQIERRGVRDPLVLEAMRTVPRHLFVPEGQQEKAYNDYPLPIGYGQTISQPYIVAFMTELMGLKGGERVLEIGTGSGYQAAVLAAITDQVYTVEIIHELGERTIQLLTSLGYGANLKVKIGDGYFGWEEYAPYDAIIVTAAAGHVPPPLIEQLKPGGRIVIPIGGVYQVQNLMVLTKTDEGKVYTKNVLPVRFVPMTGRVQD
jgi:protein-L-isoaspartate(D-aspartate) O-methyltransferase